MIPDHLLADEHEFVLTRPNWASGKMVTIDLPEGDGWFYVETVGVGPTGPAALTVWARRRVKAQAYR